MFQLAQYGGDNDTNWEGTKTPKTAPSSFLLEQLRNPSHGEEEEQQEEQE